MFPWFTASDFSVFFLFIQIRLFFNVPLGSTILSHFQRRFFYLQYITYVPGITGMRGAKAGVSPPRRSPPCTYCDDADDADE